MGKREPAKEAATDPQVVNYEQRVSRALVEKVEAAQRLQQSVVETAILQFNGQEAHAT